MSIPLRTILQRIEPQGDCWDRVRVVGRHDLGEGDEAVIAPVDGFAAPVSADPNDLWAVYQPAAEQDAPGTREAWQTPDGEVGR